MHATVARGLMATTAITTLMYVVGYAFSNLFIYSRDSLLKVHMKSIITSTGRGKEDF